jgi:hypothetical protein
MSIKKNKFTLLSVRSGYREDNFNEKRLVVIIIIIIKVMINYQNGGDGNGIDVM